MNIVPPGYGQRPKDRIVSIKPKAVVCGIIAGAWALFALLAALEHPSPHVLWIAAGGEIALLALCGLFWKFERPRKTRIKDVPSFHPPVIHMAPAKAGRHDAE